jgi:transposase
LLQRQSHIEQKLAKRYLPEHSMILTEIKDGQLSFQRNEDSIQEESEVMRDYKRLAEVEKSFRTIKTTLLEIRPIHHHLEKRVRAHLFICMLSYYVVWHLRQVWASSLFSDENLEETRANRNPVMTATPNKKVTEKKQDMQKSNSTQNQRKTTEKSRKTMNGGLSVFKRC